MTKYARDEFDKVPETASRQGVHRAVADRRRPASDAHPCGRHRSAGHRPGGLPDPAETRILPGRKPSRLGERSAAASPRRPAPAPPPSRQPQRPPSPAGQRGSLRRPQRLRPVRHPHRGCRRGQVPARGGLQRHRHRRPGQRVGGPSAPTAGRWAQIGNWGGAPQQTSVIFYSRRRAAGQRRGARHAPGHPHPGQHAEFQVPLVVVLGPGYR